MIHKVTKTPFSLKYSLLAISLFSASGPTLSDDIDLYNSQITTTTQKPNVLFIVDNSSSMWNGFYVNDNSLHSLLRNRVSAVIKPENRYVLDGFVDDFFSNLSHIKKSDINPIITQNMYCAKGFVLTSEGISTCAGFADIWILKKRTLVNAGLRELSHVSSLKGGINMAVMSFSKNADDTPIWQRNTGIDPRDVTDDNSDNDSDNGGFVLSAFLDTKDPGNLDYINKRIEEHYNDVFGASPLAESLFEAYHYFTGKTSSWKKLTWSNWLANKGNSKDKEQYKTLYGKIDTNAYQGKLIDNAYKSPWTDNPCGKNHVIFFTDGSSSWDWHANDAIQALTGAPTPIPPKPNELGAWGKIYEDVDPKNTLLDDLAGYLNRTDLAPSIDGEQNIKTHVIVSNNHGIKDVMQATTNAGGGKYVELKDWVAISDSFNTILDDIYEEVQGESISSLNYSIINPVSINNAIEQSNDVYVAASIFKNKKGVANLKKYTYNPSTGIIIDKDGNRVFSDMGEFNSDSKSLWSTITDGDAISSGGLVGNFKYDMKRYTYTGDTTPKNVLLNKKENALSTDNALLTPALFDTTTTGETLLAINHARGRDAYDLDGNNVQNEVRKSMGISIHSTPLIFHYNRNKGKQSSRLFIATNEGFLHTIDPISGEEKFAFMPQALLPSVKTAQLEISPGFQYGLDGEITAWFKDTNNDQDIEQTNGGLDPNEHLYLYLNMRRGGRNLYALDASKSWQHILKWRIEGGKTTGFERLGQTWSQPTVANIPWGDADAKTVLFFGGGYNPQQDDRTQETIKEDLTMGNALYMVDATTGALLWSASNDVGNNQIAEMKYSIPTAVTAIDTTGDGFTNALFSMDIAGQVFRCDISKTTNTARKQDISCGKIADLQNAPLKQRYYNNLDAVFVKNPATNAIDRIALSTSSGFRSNPLENKQINTFSVIMDYHPFTKPTSYKYVDGVSTIKPSHLEDTTTKVLTSAPKHGWQLDFANPGEKVFNPAVTYNNVIVFNSYTPPQSATSATPEENISSCSAGAVSKNEGFASIYSINLLTGSAQFDLNKDGSITKGDKSTMINTKLVLSNLVISRIERDKDSLKIKNIHPSATQLDPIEAPLGFRQYWFQN